MPIYRFRCGECDDVIERILPMLQSQAATKCDQCGTLRKRDYGSEHAHAAPDSYGKTKWSDSLAVSIDQIDEHRRAFPDVKIDAEGRPGFDSYRQHDAYLKKAGFVKQPNKRGKRRGTRIS